MATTLTDEMIRDGRALIEQIDNQRLVMRRALWFFSPESNTWKLVLGFRAVDRTGPRLAWEAVRTALKASSENSVLTLEDLSVRSEQDPFLKLLRQSLEVPPSESGTRVSNLFIDGQLIHDTYIYRLQ